MVLATLLELRPSQLEKWSCPLAGLAPSRPAPPALMGPSLSHCFASCAARPHYGHRSSSACSAGETLPAHEAELTPPGQLNKASCGQARPCSAFRCFSFPFPQINQLPQRETNAFVSKLGRTVSMACLPASRQELDKSPRAMESPAAQPKSLLTVLLLRRGVFGRAGDFAPCLFLYRKHHG